MPGPAQDLAKPPRALRRVAEFDVGLGGDIRALAFSGDGRLIAAGSSSGEVVVAEVDTGAVVMRLVVTREAPLLAFSPDGAKLAVVARELLVFAVPEGRLLAARKAFWAPAAWSADGRQLAVQATAAEIAVYAGDDLAERRRLPLPETGQLRMLAFGGEGERLALVQWRRGLFTVDLKSGEVTLLARGDLAGAVESGDGWRVGRASGRDPVRGEGIEDLGLARDLVAAAPGSAFLLVGRDVRWRTGGGALRCTLPLAEAAALHPSGDLAAVAKGGVVQLVRPYGSVVRELRAHRATPQHAVIAGDARHVVAAAGELPGRDRAEARLVVFDVETGESETVPTPSPVRGDPGRPRPGPGRLFVGALPRP